MKNRFRSVSLAVVVSSLALFGSTANAETYNFSFGQWLGNSGPAYQPSQSFATMAVSTTDRLTYSFELTALSNVATVFSTSAYISSVLFNTWTAAVPVATTISAGTWGVGSVELANGDPNVGGVAFDFKDSIGANSNKPASRLVAGESVKWTAQFNSVQASPFFNAPPVALHVQSFNQNGVTSGWYVPAAPIPEPETYAMLLAGLGLIGFAARRRKIK